MSVVLWVRDMNLQQDIIPHNRWITMDKDKNFVASLKGRNIFRKQTENLRGWYDSLKLI